MNKSKYQIKKVRRVLKFKGTQPATYNVWKVSGPRKLVKYFTTKTDATAWVKKFTTQYELDSDQLLDVMKGR